MEKLIHASIDIISDNKKHAILKLWLLIWTIYISTDLRARQKTYVHVSDENRLRTVKRRRKTCSTI